MKLDFNKLVFSPHTTHTSHNKTAHLSKHCCIKTNPKETYTTSHKVKTTSGQKE